MADKDDTYDSVDGLHDRAGHLARRLQQTAVAHFTRSNGSFGVTSVQYAVLIAVRDRPELDQAALAVQIALDKSTLGVVVDKLEQRGMLKRARDSVDKRRYTVRLTPRGRNLLDSMRPSVWQSESDLLAPLTATEQKKLKALINKLLQGNRGVSRTGTIDEPAAMPPRRGRTAVGKDRPEASSARGTVNR
ncbi:MULTISPECIES: MarR family winged helix-turn-helix transcriptional regulator [unclassified Beijerinckia]|uniref:MarR family winged helix-turn-helix transcriptional regulator n=1 Tax=unclassified Beijerinckia TaxID=2638183 RepID=UPI000894EE09|nr:MULTISPECIES: MarR family winged helix-turn-helix transcriptional regulator [unclassified Beijerinckia]MDH7797619.1 DNA-binding MarR family transcriptional regulator [Beijerinckia sp. GAS462]SEC92557.1 transcriptional regulator, MarR family [Beijerinckia sp. 28-YEA-48]